MNDVVTPSPVIAGAGEAAAPDTRPPWTVLCVDDEPNILSALKRSLRTENWRVLTANGGAEALETLARESVDLIISDMRMPGMDGAQLLEQVSQRWPASIRILLTGHADMNATVAAINRGRIFRYLNKPWDDEELRATVHQGLAMLALEREKQRLEVLTQQQNAQLHDANTLLEQRVADRTAALSQAHEKVKRSYLTSIKVFSGLLELREGRLAGHGRRVADQARKLAQAMGCSDDEAQQIFVAGLLHDIGLIGVPDTLLAKTAARYTPPEIALFHRHAAIGEQSLMALEEMQPVAALIRAHHERYDGQGFPDQRAGNDIPLGARILAIVDTFDDLQNGHLVETPLTAQEARTVLRHGRGTQFDPEALDVFLHITEPDNRAKARLADVVVITSAQLEPDMVLAKDLVSTTGVLMLTAGQSVSALLIRRIREFELREGGKLTLHIKPRGPG
ncbi:MAG TPA: HD domain-containing phosphohydrolase [Burkholderiaceae bacterium]|nr:HD domain-containing phosphohydrolase [Burkholderiaceae bacterium]